MTKIPGKFEAAWRADNETWMRVDGKKIKIDNNYQYFVESELGHVKNLIDPSEKYISKTGWYKDAKGKAGVFDPISKAIRDNFWGDESAGIPSNYNENPRVWYVDIETRVGQNSVGFPVPELALEQICLFQIFDSFTKEVYILGDKDLYEQEKYLGDLEYKVNYFNLKSEFGILEGLGKLFKHYNPLIIHGWMTNKFDYGYIFNRMKRLKIDNPLSNYGSVELERKEFKGQKFFYLKADGHLFLDLSELYLNFTFVPQASMKLDEIAFVELGERKVEHNDYVKFDDFYMGKYNHPSNPTEEQLNSDIYKASLAGDLEKVAQISFSTFVRYGAKDVILPYKIDKKLNLTNLLIKLAKKMGTNLDDALKTVKPWGSYIANKSYINGLIIPPNNIQEGYKTHIVGGYVRVPEVGLHHWVLSGDVNSMYPLLAIVGFNMSAEKFVPISELPQDLKELILKYFNSQNEDKLFDIPREIFKELTKLLVKYNYSMSINGAVFKKDNTGIIPELVQEIYASRKNEKKNSFKYEQYKILINEVIKEKKGIKIEQEEEIILETKYSSNFSTYLEKVKIFTENKMRESL